MKWGLEVERGGLNFIIAQKWLWSRIIQKVLWRRCDGEKFAKCEVRRVNSFDERNEKCEQERVAMCETRTIKSCDVQNANKKKL